MMRRKPSLDEFRSGGGEEVQSVAPSPAEKKSAATKTKTKTGGAQEDGRISKTIRMRPALEARVKKEVLERRLAGESRRFSESDLIEEALTFWFENAKKK